MSKIFFIGLLFFGCSYLEAKEKNSLKDKLLEAVKEYIKETDTYRIYDYGKKEYKKIKKKFNNKIKMKKNNKSINM